MKYFFVLLLVGLILVSGCTQVDNKKDDTDQTDESQNNTSGPKIGKPIGKQFDNKSINQNGENFASSSPPRIGRTSINPNNPDLGEAVNITVSAEDDQGIKEVSWTSSKPFSNGQTGSFDCGLQKTCLASFELITLDSGLHEVTIVAVDSSGQPSNPSTSEITVSTYRVTTKKTTETKTTSFTCGNSKCEGGESYLNCENDCETSKTVGTSPADGACEPGESIENAPKDCTTINPNCGNAVCDSDETRLTCYAYCEEESSDDSCSPGSSCGYKKKCIGGVCQSVDCTSNSHCSGCRKCVGNRCVSCGYGSAGYCTC